MKKDCWFNISGPFFLREILHSRQIPYFYRNRFLD